MYALSPPEVVGMASSTEQPSAVASGVEAVAEPMDQARAPARTTWYRRRSLWIALGVAALILVALVLVLRGGGANPVPGTFSGAGEDIDISFTVSPDLEVSSVAVALDMPLAGSIGGNDVPGVWPVENGAFEIRLVAPLGLEEIVIEGEFTGDGTEADGSFTTALAPGVTARGDPYEGASGSWTAANEGGG